MEVNQRVKIINTNSIWDNLEGTLEKKDGDEPDSTCVVFVDFIPEENKRVRQEFKLKNLKEI